jgi:L,D-transpeptidase-like protein
MRRIRFCVLAAALALFTAPFGRAHDLVNCATAGIKYGLEPGGSISSLKARFNSSQLELLQKLNRVDLDHLARLVRIVAPDIWAEDQLVYSPLPRSFPAGESCSKLIVVYQPAQAFGGYEYGDLVRWGPVSSGRQASQTPTGLFHLNWKSDGRHSTVDPDWFMPWYFNFGNAEGHSFHEYALPGRPASHACVRLLGSDARWLHEWGEEWRLDISRRNVLATGTPVLIVGTYDFSAPAPWRSLGLLARRVELPAGPICKRE